MDYYLSEDNCYKRLEEEFYKYGKLIFCVDFDDTLYDFHKLGRKYDKVINLLKRWARFSEVIILTSSGEEKYQEIENYLNEIGVKFKGINCDGSISFGGRKTYANAYIDDRGGLPCIYRVLEKLIDKIEKEEKYNMEKEFNALEVKNQCVEWIRDWFEENGKGCNAVIGISGGKDSSIVAGLCVEALGKDRVIGVMLPQGKQADINYSKMLIEHLGIGRYEINIEKPVNEILKGMQSSGSWIEEQTTINLPARIRMATLYAVSQSNNGRVANTCNLSEDYIGYSTRWGDSVGDFSPLANLTVQEVKEIGYVLGLPQELIEKKPSDGLCGMTDEDKIGFSYKVLDKYIRTGICEDEKIKDKIDDMHKKNLFKLKPIPSFNPKLK